MPKSIEEWNPEKKSYVSVYRPIAGWKAIQYWWNNEEPDLGGFWEPWQTSPFAFATKAEAIDWAKTWAFADELLLDPEIA